MIRFPTSGGSPSCRSLQVIGQESFFTANRRSWRVDLIEDGGKPKSVIIQDPLDLDEYLEHDESLHTTNIRDLCETADNPKRDDRIQPYYNALAKQLELPAVSPAAQSNDFTDKSRVLEVRVSDAHANGSYSIHSLLWEMLEHYDTSIRVVHTARVPQTQAPGSSDNPLSRKPFRILLVVSRSWQNNRGCFADLSPTLVFDTLCYLYKTLSQDGRRFELDVVRPGTVRGFMEHLERAKAYGVTYNMVHFDLHGRIAVDNHEPELLFAQPYRPAQPHDVAHDNILGFSDSYFEALGAQKLGDILQTHGITAVALNSCNSAYTQSTHANNLCLTLMKYGVKHATGMSFAVRGTAARLYFQGFYTSFLFSGSPFETAAAAGRAVLRRHCPDFLEKGEHEPSTLPSVYSSSDAPAETDGQLTLFQRCLAFIPFWGRPVIILWVSVYCFPFLKPWWDATDRTIQIAVILASVCTALVHRHGKIRSKDILEHLQKASSGPWQGFVRLAIEDRLKFNPSLFIEMDSSPMSIEAEAHLASTIETWKMTGFVQDVIIIDGKTLLSDFWDDEYMAMDKLPFLQQVKYLIYYLWLLVTCRLLEQRQSKPSLALPTMLVFTNFNLLFQDGTRDEDLKRALGRVSEVVEIESETKELYKLFIGTDLVPWESGGIDPEVHPWVLGTRLSASHDLGIHETT